MVELSRDETVGLLCARPSSRAMPGQYAEDPGQRNTTHEIAPRDGGETRF